MSAMYEASNIKISDENLRKVAIKIYEYIVNNFKFSINQTEIELESCNEIEYALITHDGMLVLDNFSIAIAVNSFFSTLKDYFEIKENGSFKRATLFVIFIDYLKKKGLTL